MNDCPQFEFSDLPILEPEPYRITISPHIIAAGFRFIRVRLGEKIPIDKGWQKQGGANYTADDPRFIHWLKHGNYGILCDEKHVIVELDTHAMVEAIGGQLPETFTVKSGGGIGMHFHLSIADGGFPSSIPLQDGGYLKARGGFCVGAGSIHPSGNRYEVTKDFPVASITSEELLSIIYPFIESLPSRFPEKQEKSYPTQDDRWWNKIRLADVGGYPLNSRRSGDEVFGEHPIHGSTSIPPKKNSVNFWINPSRNLWHCFAHDTGGGPLEYFAMREGLIRCEDCTRPSPLTDRRLLVKVLELLKAQGFEPE